MFENCSHFTLKLFQHNSFWGEIVSERRPNENIVKSYILKISKSALYATSVSVDLTFNLHFPLLQPPSIMCLITEDAVLSAYRNTFINHIRPEREGKRKGLSRTHKPIYVYPLLSQKLSRTVHTEIDWLIDWSFIFLFIFLFFCLKVKTHPFSRVSHWHSSVMAIDANLSGL